MNILHRYLLAISSSFIGLTIYAQSPDYADATTASTPDIANIAAPSVQPAVIDQMQASEVAPVTQISQPEVLGAPEAPATQVIAQAEEQQPITAPQTPDSVLVQAPASPLTAVQASDSQAQAPASPSIDPVIAPVAEIQPGAISDAPVAESVVPAADTAQIQSTVQEEVRGPRLTPIVQQQAPEEHEEEIEQDAIVESEDLYKDGIDTLEEEDSGNWYEKRKHWKKARPKYDEIHTLVNKIESSLKQFLDKKKNIEKTVSNFYINIGEQRTAIQERITSLIDELNKERIKDDENFSPSELKVLEELRQQKSKDLEQLKDQFTALATADEHLRQALLVSLTDQVEQARTYEEKALEAYYKISEILDDQKAKNLLHDMDGYHDNIIAIDKWIEGELKEYTQQTIATIASLVDNITANVKSLKQRGVILAKQVADEEKVEELQEKQRRDADKMAAAKKAQEEASKGIWSRITQFFTRISDSIKSFFSWLSSTILGNKANHITRGQQVVEPIVQPRMA